MECADFIRVVDYQKRVVDQEVAVHTNAKSVGDQIASMPVLVERG